MDGGQWFYMDAGQQRGPVPTAKLVVLLRGLPPGTLVWSDGMADWQRAEDVPALAAALGAPPAVPAAGRPPSAPSAGGPGSAAPAGGVRPHGAGRPGMAPRASSGGPAYSRPDDEPPTLNPFVLWMRALRFRGRFDRGEFAVSYLGGAFLMGVVYVVSILLIGAMGNTKAGGPVAAVGGLAFLVVFLLFMVIGFGSIVCRLRDAGQSPWLVLLMLLPCISFIMLIYLFVAPPSNVDAPAPSGGGGGVATALIIVGVAFVGIMMIGIIAAIAIPSLLRARVSANESAAIGDARAMVSAQMAYASGNNNYYEGKLECLGAPAQCITGSTEAGVDPSLIAPSSRGYTRELVAGPPAPPLAARSRSSVSSFAFVLRPMAPGQTGVRSFCADHTGRICHSHGDADLVLRGADEVRCSDQCQVF